MIASSLQEGDELVDILLRKEADVNVKSMSTISQECMPVVRKLTEVDYSGQVHAPAAKCVISGWAN